MKWSKLGYTARENAALRIKRDQDRNHKASFTIYWCLARKLGLKDGDRVMFGIDESSRAVGVTKDPNGFKTYRSGGYAFTCVIGITRRPEWFSLPKEIVFTTCEGSSEPDGSYVFAKEDV